MTIDQLKEAAIVRSLIRSTKGRFAKVIYTNGKGETKTYTVRTGVKKYLTEIDPDFKGLRPLGTEGPIKVYSITAGNVGYKSFLPERIKSVKCGTIQYLRS